jgi:hypothetical protein
VPTTMTANVTSAGLATNVVIYREAGIGPVRTVRCQVVPTRSLLAAGRGALSISGAGLANPSDGLSTGPRALAQGLIVLARTIRDLSHSKIWTGAGMKRAIVDRLLQEA